MLPVSRVKGRVYFYIYCDQQNPYVPDGVAGEARVFFLKKKKPGPDKILYHDRKKTPQL